MCVCIGQFDCIGCGSPSVRMVCVCIRECEREKTLSESFDSTVFLSWRHLLPSSNLSVYQAKMLGKRLLRQLDNTTPTHTHTQTFPHPPSQHPPSQHLCQQPNPIIYRKVHKHTQITQTPMLLLLHILPQTPAECCAILRRCGWRTYGLKM